MSIEPSTRLLHYEIVERIGEGGMGVVWKALDTTLGREVAIKVLPPALANEAERLARFEHEARILASLDHPNIASVYGLHTDGNVRFLAMEYIAGEDISQRLARGRLPVEETLGYARQITDALQTAHQSGIVHRDLKPANVMRTTDGKIKVLDFGLAKALEADPTSGVNPSMSPTLTSHGTLAGVILGTAGYMSPEQARGEPADKRSDVFSFGVLLYEMLTGARAFHGDTVTDTLASVLKLDPDWSLLPAGLPRGIPRLLDRCLRKDPNDRLHDIADARIEIVEALDALERGETATGATDVRPRAARWVVAAWAIAGVLAGGAVVWALRPAAPEPSVRRFVVRTHDVTSQPLSPRISPDGGMLVYRSDARLHLHDLERGETHEVAGTDGASHPFWSPDGSAIGYQAGGRLWRVDTVGSVPTPICDLGRMRGAAWNDVGTIGVVYENELMEVPARGGELKTVLELPEDEFEDFHGIDALPDGGGWVVLVHETNGPIAVEVVRGQERQRLAAHEDVMIWMPRYAHPGYVLYNRQGKNGGIWAVPLDTGGDPFVVAAGGRAPSASRDGTLAYRPANTGTDNELLRFGRDKSVIEKYNEPRIDIRNPTLSPDGKRILMSTTEDDLWDLRVYDIVRGIGMRLTVADGREGLARWYPDGERVYFHSPVNDVLARIYSLPAGGGESPKDLAHGMTAAVSSDGKRMVFARDGGDTDYDLWSWELDGESEPEPWLTARESQSWPMLSPDGEWLAYQSTESGQNEVYIKPFPSGTGRWQVSVDGGQRPSWSPDGKTLYYALWSDQGNYLYEVNVTYGDRLELSAPRSYFDGDAPFNVWRGHEVLPDGESVLGIRRADDGQEEDENAMPDGVVVVQNWLAEFRD